MAKLHKRSHASVENSHSLVIPEAGDWALRLAKIALQIRQSSDLPTILQTTVEAVQQLLGCDRALIYRFEPNGSSTVTVEAVSAPQWSLLDRDTQDACFQACWLEPLQENQIAEFWAPLEVKANLAVPLRRESQLWGLLMAHSCTSPHPWTDGEIDSLQHIAVQAELAIDQAERIAQLQATQTALEVQVTRCTQALAQANQQLSAKVEECQAIATTLGQVQDERFQLAAIVESSQDAIVSKTLDGIITSWNSAAEQLFGYGKAEAIGQSIYLLIPPDRQSEEILIFQRVHRGERVESYETQRLHKNGSLIDVALTISPIHDENGAVIGASKIARDIRDRKRSERRQHETEQALQATQEQFRAFMNHAPVLAWMVDRDGIVNYGNAEWLAFVGHTVQSALGRSIHDLVPPEFSQGYLHNNHQIINSQYSDSQSNNSQGSGDLTQTGGVLETIEQGRALNGVLHTYLVRKF
ncbi:MAG TPA: PAS domain S-box protein, partial [Chroococcidiopsis sp.]